MFTHLPRSCRLLANQFRMIPSATSSLQYHYLRFQTNYFATESGVASGDSNRLILTLSSPSECPFKKVAVSSVTLPGVEGEFTISPQHSPLVTFLRNGVITVRPVNSSKESQFFVSDGLCLVQGPTEDNSQTTAEIIGIEMVPTEFLDKERTTQVLQDLLQSTSGSTDEWEKAKSMLGQELCSAILRSAP